MLFNSLTYLVFMSIATVLVVFGPPRLRNMVLLVGSLAFYGFWRLDFLALVIFTAFTDYFAGMRIADAQSARVRKIWLTVSIVMNLVVLGFFKYTFFILGSLQEILGYLGVPANFHLGFTIILPLGISFYTFQSMSYTIDVFRRVQEPVRSFRLFITYVMLWPQLVAGPILRTSEVVPQIVEYRRPKAGEVTYGLEEILQGLFKKLVLADGIAPLVDAGFSIPVSQLGTLDVWTLAFAFGFQIYFDFSGYSQIALGSARVMGFQFPRNFNWPYLATSPREFWKRWHISLSTWIRDYLYLPLSGVRFRGSEKGRASPKGEDSAVNANEEASETRRNVALFLTWFIMGLWHGANWTFALWGVWHATLIFVHRVSEPLRERLPILVRSVGGWALTLSFAMLGWIFFRASSVHDALAMVARAFDVSKIRTMAMRENDYLTTAIFLLGLLATAGCMKLNQQGRVPTWLRCLVMVAAQSVMFFAVFLLLRQVKSFIYFQF